MKTKLIFFIVFLNISWLGNAQIFDAAQYIKGGKEDAVKMIAAYLMPIEHAIGFNGANNNIILFKHKDDTSLNYGFGLDLTASFININDYNYDVNKLDLVNFEAVDPENSIAQTAAGSAETIALQTRTKYKTISSSYPFFIEKPILTFNSAKGNTATYVPFPTVHLFAEKEGNAIDVKVLPSVKFTQNGEKIGLFNLGIYPQHNLATSSAFFSNLPVDFYVAGGYNYNRVTYYLDVKPNESYLTFSSNVDEEKYKNQSIQLHTSSIPVRFTVVKPINKVLVFANIGYNFLASKVKMVGNYPIYASDPSDQYSIVATDIEDPFEYSHKFNSISGTLGLNYRTDHITTGIKYNYSYYKNIDFSLSYIF